MKHLKFRSGLTLIEVAVAIGIAAVIGSVLMAVALQAQIVSNSSVLASQATQYDNQILENALAYKKATTWTNFVSYATGASYQSLNIGGTMDQNNGTGVVCSVTNRGSQISGTNFYQCFTLTNLTAVGESGLVQIDAYIFYKDRGKDMTVKFVSYISEI